MKKEGKIIDFKKIIGINPNKETLTVEKLKTFPGFENLNDKEAEEMVFAIQTFATILYELMSEQELIKIRSEKSANETNQLNKAA